MPACVPGLLWCMGCWWPVDLALCQVGWGEWVNSKKIQSDPHLDCVDKTVELTRRGDQWPDKIRWASDELRWSDRDNEPEHEFHPVHYPVEEYLALKLRDTVVEGYLPVQEIISCSFADIPGDWPSLFYVSVSSEGQMDCQAMILSWLLPSGVIVKTSSSLILSFRGSGGQGTV